MAHDHEHDDEGHHHGSELSEMQLRVRALETVLAEKGYVDPAALDLMIEAYETKIGPHNGARVVAKAWSDPAFKQALIADATKAVQTLGLDQPRRRSPDRRREYAQASQHDRVYAVLLLSVGSARPAAGLVQVGALSLARGQRSARRARRFRRRPCRPTPQIRVWDSTAETRFIVLPMRPAGTEGWSEEKLATLVTRDCMIGTGLPKLPSEVA